MHVLLYTVKTDNISMQLLEQDTHKHKIWHWMNDIILFVAREVFITPNVQHIPMLYSS